MATDDIDRVRAVVVVMVAKGAMVAEGRAGVGVGVVMAEVVRCALPLQPRLGRTRYMRVGRGSTGR